MQSNVTTSIPLDAARRELAVSALPLAYQLAGRLAARTSLPRERAVDAAIDGLLLAALRYDEARGANFCTFAHLSIRHRLTNALQAHLRRNRIARTRPFSQLDRDGDNPLDPADDAPPVWGEVEAADRRATLARVEGLLPPRLWLALHLYFGEGLTLEQVGQRVVPPVGKERVRQLVAEAIRLVRRDWPERIEGDPVPRR